MCGIEAAYKELDSTVLARRYDGFGQLPYLQKGEHFSAKTAP